MSARVNNSTKNDREARIGIGWEHFAHGADMGIRGFGTTRDEAFEQAALSMIAVMSNPQSVAAQSEIHIDCEAPNGEFLLVDWLNAIVYEVATRNMLFGRFEVRTDNSRLRARAWGERINVAKHQPVVEVKGATYTELCVANKAQGWVAQCVVDV